MDAGCGGWIISRGMSSNGAGEARGGGGGGGDIVDTIDWRSGSRDTDWNEMRVFTGLLRVNYCVFLKMMNVINRIIRKLQEILHTRRLHFHTQFAVVAELL